MSLITSSGQSDRRGRTRPRLRNPQGSQSQPQPLRHACQIVQYPTLVHTTSRNLLLAINSLVKKIYVYKTYMKPISHTYVICQFYVICEKHMSHIRSRCIKPSFGTYNRYKIIYSHKHISKIFYVYKTYMKPISHTYVICQTYVICK